MSTQTQEILTRAMATAAPPLSVNEADRTVTVCFYSGAPVLRNTFFDGPYLETFDLSGMSFERVKAGSVPVVDSHGYSTIRNQVGTVKRAWVDGGKGYAELQISDRPEVDGLWRDIVAGVVRGVSMGVQPDAIEETKATGKSPRIVNITKSTLLEISFVVIGADGAAVTRSYGQGEPMETQPVSTTQPAAPVVITREQEAATIRQRVKAARLPDAFAEDLITRGVGPHEASTLILDRLADNFEANPTRTAHAQVTRDGGETERTGLQNLMLHRFAPIRYPFPQGQVSGTMTLLEIARRDLEIRGIRTHGKRDSEIIQLSFQSTSDFPNLFTSTGDRRLADAYAESASPLRQLFRIVDAKDFRAKSVVKFQGVTDLLEVPEGGEVQHAPVHEEAESYTPKQYARQTTFTEQAMKNDDLEALLRLPDEFGKAASRLEADQAVALLQAGSGLGPLMADGKRLFHTDHGNLSGTSDAIADTSIAAGLLAIRLQKNLDATSVLGLTPKFLLCSATKEVTARKQVATIYPAQTSDANPLQGTLIVLAESRLDAGSTTRWYLACSPDQAAVFELAFLDGRRGPRIESKSDWDRLGLAIRCVHEIGLGVIDYRGIYSNAGA